MFGSKSLSDAKTAALVFIYCAALGSQGQVALSRTAVSARCRTMLFLSKHRLISLIAMKANEQSCGVLAQ